jgi:hypothetical protein
VKEREAGKPCYVVLELKSEPSSRHVVLDFREGTTVEDAKAVARLLNHKVKAARVGLLT